MVQSLATQTWWVPTEGHLQCWWKWPTVSPHAYKTHAFKGDNCSGRKNLKDSLPVLLWANAYGSDKMTPLIREVT